MIEKAGIHSIHMSSQPPGPSLPERGQVSDAALEIAATIHRDLLNELPGAPATGFEDMMAAQRERYPGLLFGDLAMHLAEVELPANPTQADRSKGVVEALRRISSTPSLFEAVTGAPFSQELASDIARELQHKPTSIQGKKEAKAADTLRSTIQEKGYLESSMIPNGRPVQLRYEGLRPAKQRLFRSDVPPMSLSAVLKLVPHKGSGWTVKTYGRWASDEGFTKPQGERRVNLNDVFTLLAAETTDAGEELSQLDRMVNSTIRLGKISSGTALKIEYGFTRKTQEVPGYEPSIESNSVTFPLKLVQAYLGTTQNFPLFGR